MGNPEDTGGQFCHLWQKPCSAFYPKPASELRVAQLHSKVNISDVCCQVFQLDLIAYTGKGRIPMQLTCSGFLCADSGIDAGAKSCKDDLPLARYTHVVL